jgi:hypothetical protein
MIHMPGYCGGWEFLDFCPALRDCADFFHFFEVIAHPSILIGLNFALILLQSVVEFTGISIQSI